MISEIETLAFDAVGRALTMGALEHQQVYARMLEVTSRFRHAVNYRGDIGVPLLPRHPASSSSSASTARSCQVPASSSRPPHPVTVSAPLPYMPRPSVFYTAGI